MKERFAELDCFVLAGGENNRELDFETAGQVTRLEKGYRRYAALFERVTLVLKKDQAVEKYLNYPHVCDVEPQSAAIIGVKTALDRAASDPVFIGSSEFCDFPLELAVELVRRYDGELFLGYHRKGEPEDGQPLFGLFSKKLLDHLDNKDLTKTGLARLLDRSGRFVPLPEDVESSRIGLN